MMLSVRSKMWAARAVMAAVVFCLTACGRGPVEPIATPNNPTIELQLWVQGQITPSQGDYIIAVNENTGTTPNFVNLNQANGEQPGEPTIIEAYGVNPPPFTHWDQAVLYGNSASGLPNCQLAPSGGFAYCYKVVTQSGGGVTIKFIPIITSPNEFTFNPSGNGGSGTGNAIILRMPLSCLSIFAGADGFTCDSVTPLVTQIYVNFITLDNTTVPQDQLACISGQSFIIDTTRSNTQQLVKSACTAPPNQNLQIIGGIVRVIVPGP